uniref:Glycosyl transferases group 1 family protein n=1 Tax=Trepomonas sp. PC1 TaxID=1076344 RepID=A0A146KJK1_9EUKA|eukprot:JAP95636.1 Glycosyl transferases group 1 family protein [Trepomonas sp. PC1]
MTLGGVKRVTQLLSTLLASHDHKVVVVTGPIRKDEYVLDKTVNRLVLPNFFQDIYNLTKIAEQQFDVVIFQNNWQPRLLRAYKHYVDNGMKVIAIDHSVYLNLHYKNLHKIRTDNSLDLQISNLRHENLPVANALVCLSSFDQFIWKQLGVKARFIPNPTTFTNAPIDKRPPIIINVGRLIDKDKQALLAIKAMKQLHEMNNESILKMIGPFDHQLQQAAAGSPFIQLLGFQSNVQEHMRNASVLMMTSQYEGYPMVVVEAISQGIPVVSFALKYLAINKCGVVQVPKRDTLKMAEEINKLLSNETLRQVKATLAQKCLDEMNSEVLPKWNDLLDKVVNNKEIDFKDEVDQQFVENVLVDEMKGIRQMAEQTQKQNKVERSKKVKTIKRQFIKRKK